MPAAVVTACMRALVSRSIATTFAPATTPSEGSVTIPVIVPFVVCPYNACPSKKAAGTANQAEMLLRISPPHTSITAKPQTTAETMPPPLHALPEVHRDRRHTSDTGRGRRNPTRYRPVEPPHNSLPPSDAVHPPPHRPAGDGVQSMT